MFKKTLFAVFGLAMALAFASPEKAHAGVAIGVTVGPVYARPVYPYAYVYPRPYAQAYVYPRPYAQAYVYPRPYVYPGPVVYGNYNRGPYWRHERFERHAYAEHRGYYDHDRYDHDRYDHDRYDHDRYERDRR
jgi:hypothetical protein